MAIKEFFDNGVYKFIENQLAPDRPNWLNTVSPRTPLPDIVDFDPATYSTQALKADNPISSFNFRLPVGPQATPGTPEHLQYVKDELSFRSKLNNWQNSRVKRRSEIKTVLNIIEMERHIVFLPVIAALLAMGNLPAAAAMLITFTPDIQRIINFRRARIKEAIQSQQENPLPPGGNLIGQIYTFGKAVKSGLESNAANLDKYAKGGLPGAINSINKGLDGFVEGINKLLEGPENFRKKTT